MSTKEQRDEWLALARAFQQSGRRLGDVRSLVTAVNALLQDVASLTAERDTAQIEARSDGSR